VKSTDVADVAATQAGMAMLLAAFAFAAFVLLLNNISSTSDTPFGLTRVRHRSHEGRALFLLVATFTVGILAGFLYATSVGDPDTISRGYTIAQVVFGVEVYALITAVLVLLDLYLRTPGPMMVWMLSLAVVGWALFRIVIDIRGEWKRDVGNEAIYPLAIASIVPSILVIFLFAAGRVAAMRQQRRSTSANQSGLAMVDSFFLRSSVGYALMMAVIGVYAGTLHVWITQTEEARFSTWQLLLLAASLSVAATWTALHSLPGMDGPRIVVGDDGHFFSVELPGMATTLNESVVTDPVAGRDRIVELRASLSAAKRTIDKSRSVITVDREVELGGHTLFVTPAGFVRLRDVDHGGVTEDEFCDVEHLVRVLGSWERDESKKGRRSTDAVGPVVD
jgi:hypothetical protein